MIGQAQTGSGKTAAFGLPMLQYADADDGDVQGLVLTPTRELCIQVTQALRAYGKRKGVDVVAVFGGAPIRSQQAQLRAGGQIVVGTVGRVKDLISRHSLMLHACRFVVLDEADEMLDLGFLEDVERILALTPSSRQTALFSATMPPEIRRLADQYLYDPVTIKVKNPTADRRHRRAVRARGPRPREDRGAGPRAGGRASRPGARVRPHQDPLRSAVPDAARPRHERPGAARRHEPGRSRRRDDLVQERRRPAAGRHRRRGPRPRHLGHLARHQLRRAHLARRVRAPDRPHRPGRAQRAARSPSTSRVSSATSRRSRTTRASSCRRGSRTRASRRRPRRHRRSRHSKPHVSANGAGPEREADRLRRAAPPGSSRRTSSTRSRPRARSTARRSPTSGCCERFALVEVPAARRRAGRGAGRRDRDPGPRAPVRARPRLTHAAGSRPERRIGQFGVNA